MVSLRWYKIQRGAKVLTLQGFFLFINCFVCLKLDGQITHNQQEGDSLFDLKKADETQYYKYTFDTKRAILLKFHKGRVLKYQFITAKTDSLQIDTSYFDNGFTIFAKKPNGKKVYHSLQIFNRHDQFSLIIAARSPADGNLGYGASYFYYSNKRIASIIKEDRSHNIKKVVHFKRNGGIGSEETLDSAGRMIGLVVYNVKGKVDFKMRNTKEFTVREQWDGKGHLVQIDSLDQSNLHTGHLVRYYTTGVVKVRIPYENGLVDGVVVHYYPTGKVEKTETYSQNRKSGEHIFYNKDGQVRKRQIIQK